MDLGVYGRDAISTGDLPAVGVADDREEEEEEHGRKEQVIIIIIIIIMMVGRWSCECIFFYSLFQKQSFE